MVFLLRESKYTKQARGKVVNVYCGSIDNQGSCIAQVQYSVDAEVYKATVKSTDVLIQDQEIKILYNPNDKYDAIYLKSISPHLLGGILIGVGALIFILGFFLL